MSQTIIVKTRQEIIDEKFLILKWLLIIIAFIFLVVILRSIFPNFDFHGFEMIYVYIIGIIVIILIVRAKNKRKSRKKKNKGWKRIKPKRWVIRKMKRRRTNFVNGEKYKYMRKNGKYYRKLRR